MRSTRTCCQQYPWLSFHKQDGPVLAPVLEPLVARPHLLVAESGPDEVGSLPLVLFIVHIHFKYLSLFLEVIGELFLDLQRQAGVLDPDQVVDVGQPPFHESQPCLHNIVPVGDDLPDEVLSIQRNLRRGTF